MKIFMTGGSGFVGTFLSRELALKGHEVTILTRSERAPAPTQTGISFLNGNPAQEGPWMAAVVEHDWVINLAGASVFGRWDAQTKNNIYDSRILTTRNLIKALAAGDRRQFFCSTSVVGYYGLRGEETLTEESAPGTDFLAQVSQEWEAEAMQAQNLGVRTVITRFGLVLGKNGGVLGQMAPLFKNFLGGPVGSGRQWFSWIHQEDHARAFLFLQDHPEITGPVNLTAPHPVRNRELARALGKALRRPSFLPAPAFVVRLLLGEFAQVVLEGQKVLPEKLLNAGFTFLYPDLDQALAHLL